MYVNLHALYMINTIAHEGLLIFNYSLFTRYMIVSTGVCLFVLVSSFYIFFWLSVLDKAEHTQLLSPR